MKFRGKMIDAMAMRQFSATIASLAKLGKRCVIKLTHQNIFLIMSEDSVPRRPLAWCELEVKNFFTEYNVFGVSEEHNEIYLEFSTDMLSKALTSLKSSQTSKSIKIKLTNKKSPCLTCEIELPTLTLNCRIVVHDIPVEVIPRREWSEFIEPALPAVDVSVIMPSLRMAKSICERMKALSQYIIISANRNGLLCFKIETDLATVVTHFKNLEVEVINEDNTQHKDDLDKLYTVRVDCKKFIGFLSSEQMNPSKVICKLIDKKLVNMTVIHDDVKLQYFIPSVIK